MRKELEALLRDKMRKLAIKTRKEHRLTQKEMATKLYMLENSYSDIETGRTNCGSLTIILLLQMQKDPNAVIDDLSIEFQKLYEMEMSIV